LHVRKGRAYELQIYKVDGSPIKREPAPEDMQVIHLPA
jgi:hypothetical protein